VVLLDDALRRSGDALAITPEANNVQGLDLYLAPDDKVTVVYYDDGEHPGVFVRQLGPDGRIASPAVRILRSKPLDYRALVVVLPDASRYLVWIEQLEGSGSDLMAAKLAPGGDSVGPAKRLTAFPTLKGVSERAQGLSAAIARGNLQLSFTLAYPGPKSEVALLAVPLTLLASSKGVERADAGFQGVPPVLGTLHTVAKVAGRVPDTRLACENDGCLVTWDEEKGGASMAFLEHGRVQPLWHRQFSAKGLRPSLVGDASGMALVWYEDSRVKLAPVGRDGARTPSVVNRVNGLQPHASVARGQKPGEWLVAWRDYEAGHLELFVLRAECP
jgi:serine/threonine-protein kinase